MEVTTVNYQKTFPLQGYSNEKIGVEFKLQPGEDPIKAFAEAKLIVEKSHKFFKDLPSYEQAKKVTKNPMDFTGRDVLQAEEIIKAFESNYPDYMQNFSITRELENNNTARDSYDGNDDEGLPFD